MPQTLAEYPRLHVADKNEIAYVHRRGLRTLRWTYRRLGELAFRFARELAARNIGKGDRVILWGENGGEWVAAFFGCMLRGVVAVPMDRIAAPQVAPRVAAGVGAKLIVCSTALAAPTAGPPHFEVGTFGQTLPAPSP